MICFSLLPTCKLAVNSNRNGSNNTAASLAFNFSGYKMLSRVFYEMIMRSRNPGVTIFLHLKIVQKGDLAREELGAG